MWIKIVLFYSKGSEIHFPFLIITFPLHEVEFKKMSWICSSYYAKDFVLEIKTMVLYSIVVCCNFEEKIL